MRAPAGLSIDKSQACLLKKSLYGLKQASRQWYAKLSSSLHSQGFSQSGDVLSELTALNKKTSSSMTFVAIYVDDILITGDVLSDFTALKDFLHQSFHIQDLGELSLFLGIEFIRTS